MIWPRYRTELWRIGILHAPIARVINQESVQSVPITWLPEEPDFCFVADPFGLWREGCLYIFCEAFDYRTKRGVIRHYRYSADFELLGQSEVLRTDHHLSYPYIIQDGSEIYMLPEAHRSGKLTLYRAHRFPDVWEEVCEILHLPVVDPSIIFWEGRWWMFYALAGPGGSEMRELHVAVADKVTGPWHVRTGNPVRSAIDSSRPGGTPFVAGRKLYLPTQNCDGGYGRSITLLGIETLADENFGARQAGTVSVSDLGIAGDGMHTLSECGPVTLFDVKRIDRSSRRALINIERRVRRLWRSGS